MARFHASRSTQRSKRLTEWILGPSSVDGAFSASGKALWSFGAFGDRPVTIVRIRGHMSLYMIASSTVGTGFFGALGIGLVSDEAFAAGVASIPGPLVSADWDGWIWHNFFDVRAITGTIADGANADSVVARIEIDSKAMRRWDAESMTLVGVTEVVESIAGQLETQGDSRVLIKS